MALISLCSPGSPHVAHGRVTRARSRPIAISQRDVVREDANELLRLLDDRRDEQRKSVTRPPSVRRSRRRAAKRGWQPQATLEHLGHGPRYSENRIATNSSRKMFAALPNRSQEQNREDGRREDRGEPEPRAQR